MSFLAGRLAGNEGAYFYQESKNSVGRLIQKNAEKKIISSPTPSSSAIEYKEEAQADVLPEVLRHSLPLKVYQQQPSDSSFSSASKWVLHSDPNYASSVSRDALNPLRAYVSLPQVTFGPRRWELPAAGHSVLASTANDLRRDKHTHVNPEKLKAAAEGLSKIGKAFAVATAIVFGGATLVFGLAASKLELHNSEDIRTKVRDRVQPKSEMVREQLIPLRTWAENKSKRWHFERNEDIREKPMVKKLSKILGTKTSI